MKMTHARNEKGAALVEYGILVGLIAVLAIGSVLTLGEEVKETFLNVSTTLASNLGTPDAVAPPAINPSSVTFTVGERSPGGNFGLEFGWSQASVDQNAGTLISQTNGNYEIVTLYTQGVSGEMRLYLAGDVSGDDFTGVVLICNSGSTTYDLSNADNFTADYRAGDDATFWLWQGIDRQFVTGEQMICVIQ